MDDPLVKALRDALVQTLSTNPAIIKQAEASLKAAAAQPGYALALLKVVATDAPVELRQSAAVNFKNTVKAAWAPPPADPDSDAPPPPTLLSPADRAQIKALLPGLMLSAPPVVRAQLSEALVVIGKHDFPAAWPELLPDLVQRLTAASGGSPAAHGVLATANAIYKRYRGAFMTDALSAELEYSQVLVAPLLAALRGALDAARAAAAAADERSATTAVDTARLACRVFYSLNSPGLTEDFERALDGWMAALRDALALECAPAATPPRDGSAAPLDALRASVCDNVNLFVEMNEEEFAPYLPHFARDVWGVLVAVGSSAARDALATAATRFLTTVARGVHASLFTADGGAALTQVVESVVLPALTWRDDDEDAFAFNYVDYIRADAEAADADTRRRAATELVRALADRFPAEVGPLVGGLVERLLAEAGAPTPTGVAGVWRAKHTAVALVGALAARARAGGAAAGVAAAAAPFVDVAAFYAAHIAPQLAARAGAPPARSGSAPTS